MIRPIPTDARRMTQADLERLDAFFSYDRVGALAQGALTLQGMLVLWAACGDWDGLDAFGENDPAGFSAALRKANRHCTHAYRIDGWCGWCGKASL